MVLLKRFGCLVSGGLLASALLTGCGSSSDKNAIPSTVDIIYAHSVALKTDPPGTLYSWGYNGFGQLGNGNLETQEAAAPVPGLGNVLKFATGGVHTLAVTSANPTSVYAWGSNYYGQIGPDKPTSGSGAYSSTPIAIPMAGAVAVTDVAAGAFHSLAVVDGKVRAWGRNDYGQLGNNGFVIQKSPVEVVDTALAPIGNISSVAAGGSHSLALTTAGTVYAWGNNTKGQLAVDPATPTPLVRRSTAELVAGPPANVSRIAAGGQTSYALAGGEVWYWGYNPATQATVPTPAKINIPALPAGVTITAISAGWDHLLMLDSAGHVWGWGFNFYSQLVDNSDGSRNTIEIPVQVLDASGNPLGGVTDIIAFGNHSLAKADGVWYGWGYNGNGEVGIPISETEVNVEVPTPVQGF